MKLSILSCEFGWEERRLRQCALDLGHEVAMVRPQDVHVFVSSECIRLASVDGTDRALIRRTLEERERFLVIAEWLLQRGIPSIEAPSLYLSSSSTIQATLRRSGSVPLPPTWGIYETGQLAEIQDQLEFPVVCKLDRGRRGEGVVLCLSQDELAAHVREHFATTQNQPLVIQKKLDVLREYRVLILDGRAIATCLKIPQCGHSVANAAAGATFVDAAQCGVDEKELDRVRRVATTACADVHGIVFGGVDIVVDSFYQPFVLECNRNPKFRESQRACAEIDIAQKVIQVLVEMPQEFVPAEIRQTPSLNHD